MAFSLLGQSQLLYELPHPSGPSDISKNDKRLRPYTAVGRPGCSKGLMRITAVERACKKNNKMLQVTFLSGLVGCEKSSQDEVYSCAPAVIVSPQWARLCIHHWTVTNRPCSQATKTAQEKAIPLNSTADKIFTDAI